MASLLFLCTEVEEHRAARHERRDLDQRGELEPPRLLVERALVLGGETEPAVLAREADAREPAVPEQALQTAVAVDLGELHRLVGAGGHLVGLVGTTIGVGAWQVVRDPHAGAGPEVLDGLDAGLRSGRGQRGHTAPTRRSVTLRRWSDGVP